MRELIIAGGKAITSKGITQAVDICLEEGVISALGPVSRAGRHVLDARGCLVAPGFIDIHAHGGGGRDAMDGTAQAVVDMAEFHWRGGTTSLCPTVMTGPVEDMLASVRAVAQAASYSRAIAGIHIEGPFINPNHKGAQHPGHIVAPDPELLQCLLDECAGHRRILTLAPEVPGAHELIRLAVNQGVLVSAGHSGATYGEMRQAAALGLSQVTHVFNAMRGLHHREPGIVGAALTMDSLTCELIADGLHVHPAVMALVAKVKGKDGVVLVTDAMRAAGLGEGSYGLGGHEVVVKGREARLISGELAGTVLTMGEAVGNMVRLAGLDIVDAVYMASSAPARVLGMAGHKGEIAPGKHGDLVLLDENTMEVVATVIMGEVVYESR